MLSTFKEFSNKALQQSSQQQTLHIKNAGNKLDLLASQSYCSDAIYFNNLKAAM